MKVKKLLTLSLSVVALSAVLLSACSSDKSAPVNGGSATAAPPDKKPAAAATILDEIKSRGKMVVGVKYDTKLFGLKDPASGKVEGFDVDIAKALAKQILGDENKIELMEVTSKTRIPMLNNKEIDMIVATMTITEERRQQVEFSEVYFKAGQSLLVKKGSPIKGIEDVKKGTKVLAVKGSTSVDNVKKAVPDVNVLEFDNYQDAFSALKAGQGDTLTTDNAILYGMAAQDSNYEVVGQPFTDEPYGIAIKKEEKALLNAVNEGLKTLHSNGEYDKIYGKWIGTPPSK
ncbi:transporter substrate-binding domain-containing protein [Paenibacillus planticolens]|uniref:Transporter substrate-binding domain-containing protein n=1 Tax=Paenibacillus planticolens TaxID=2654976 RepID=A0ABX1ZQV5_9BACL|nr:transporter substrate-binding domain-containing protein [Paenibacillus planticolens]NOV02316.1 transporter substrate-binding domain-containing protein [Paenibacillus planticolens]